MTTSPAIFSRRAALQTILAAAALPATGLHAQTADADLGVAQIQALVEEAYIYGLPIVMNYAVMYAYAVDKTSSQFKAPFNQIRHEARVFTPKDTAVVTPNSDTPYSFSWLDLRTESIVISVGAVDKDRYYSVMLCDGNTFNYGLFGSATTGRDAGDFLVVGPDWQGLVPKGIKQVFRATTQFGLVGFRTQLKNSRDMDNVRQIQAGYQVRTLSAFAANTAPPPAPAIDFPKVDKALMKTNFFGYLDFALQFAPVGSEEKAIRGKLASLGVGIGDFAKFKAIAARAPGAVVGGMKAGEEKVVQAAASGERHNGWLLPKVGGGSRTYFAGNWMNRAVLARMGIYGLDKSEAIYFLTRNLGNGELLDGNKHRYTLTFAVGELPPADAFWSLTMYDSATQLLVENPIDRYLINSMMLPAMKKNADGSVTLHIQKDSPGIEQQSNWLPAPDGPIYLVLRLYVPQQRILNNQWQIPPLVLAA